MTPHDALKVNEKALLKRHRQGWLNVYSDRLDDVISLVKKHRSEKTPISIGYLGNVVDLWERIVEEYEKRGELLADMGSDQTSCHDPFNGGYYPVGLSVPDSNRMMVEDSERFQQTVRQSLRRQIDAIKKLAAYGMYFWDYGNAFLVECHRAGADVLAPNARDDKTFIFPSYMQDIMGDIFSLGFGPFRWVCASGLDEDLQRTDSIAESVIGALMNNPKVSKEARQQYDDNRKWIASAGKHQLVVGSKARILYSNQAGRVMLALKFNEAVRNGELKGPVVISRDHHDVSGTDSPFRETSNISDGSAYTADMAVQNVIGDACRGATWVALHNGGGVGWGDVINGGFGLLLDGSTEASQRAESMLNWDVANGVARRCWSGNPHAFNTVLQTMQEVPGLKVTIPNAADEMLIERLGSTF